MEEIDGKLFGYHICPRFGKVYAEIYYKTLDKNSLEVQVLKNEFGSIWRSPLEKDYKEAQEWCKNQLKWLRESNAK